MFDLDDFKAHFSKWAEGQEPSERDLYSYHPDSRDMLTTQYALTECGKYLLIPYTESAECKFIMGLSLEDLTFNNYATGYEWQFNRLLAESGYPFRPEKQVSPVTLPNLFTDSLYDK